MEHIVQTPRYMQSASQKMIHPATPCCDIHALNHTLKVDAVTPVFERPIAKELDRDCRPRHCLDHLVRRRDS